MLPTYQTQNKDFSLMQTQWASQLNPLLENPLSKANILTNVSVVSGDNVINHKLGRKLQGWMVAGMQTGFVQLYDKQNTNLMPDLTLILHSNGASTLTLVVF